MPYKHRRDLPDSVKHALSEHPHAQQIYKESFNSAFRQYGQEDRAHAVAWAAVKRIYEKGSDGRWRQKKRGTVHGRRRASHG